MLCQWRDIFGRPGEGVHQWRVGGLAAVDLGLTLLASLLLAKYLNQPVWLVSAFLMLLAIFIHRLFCVNTALNVWIWGPV